MPPDPDYACPLGDFNIEAKLATVGHLVQGGTRAKLSSLLCSSYVFHADLETDGGHSAGKVGLGAKGRGPLHPPDHSRCRQHRSRQAAIDVG